MATTEVEISLPVVVGGRLDLQEFVQNATWRELLTDLVSSNRLDPWDIDITSVVDGYLGVIKRMGVLDLRVPANIVLAASILLRMKSDTISIFGKEAEEEEVQEYAEEHGRMPSADALIPRSRMQPRRKITLEELIDALDAAMKLQERRSVRAAEMSVPQINLVVGDVDIDEKKELVLETLRRCVGKDNMTTFSSLSACLESGKSVLMDLFIPMLFLAQDARISMVQDEFFGEIFIRLLDFGVDEHGKAG